MIRKFVVYGVNELGPSSLQDALRTYCREPLCTGGRYVGIACILLRCRKQAIVRGKGREIPSIERLANPPFRPTLPEW